MSSIIDVSTKRVSRIASYTWTASGPLYLYCGEGIDLVHAVNVSLGELEVLHVGEVLAELGQVGHQLVKGHKVEVDGGSALGPRAVPGPLQELDGGRAVDAQRVVFQLDEIVVALLARAHRRVRVSALGFGLVEWFKLITSLDLNNCMG